MGDGPLAKGNMSYAIGLDLGGSSVKAVGVARDGKKLLQRVRDFNPDEHMQWAEAVRNTAIEIQRERGAAAEWIGLSAPGLAAADGASIACMPGRLQGLEGLNWSEV